MNKKIYWAGPLHQETDRERNARCVDDLRRQGHEVYLPQEHGVWEDLCGKDLTEAEVRSMLYRMDMDAMRWADTCIVCCNDPQNVRAPSEGAMFEMGWMKGANKTVILFNPDNCWRYNLMPQFGADEVFTEWEDVINFLEMQCKC